MYDNRALQTPALTATLTECKFKFRLRLLCVKYEFWPIDKKTAVNFFHSLNTPPDTALRDRALGPNKSHALIVLEQPYPEF
jgi:hypothetical protein